MNKVHNELIENHEFNEYVLKGEAICRNQGCKYYLNFNDKNNVNNEHGFWCNRDCYREDHNFWFNY